MSETQAPEPVASPPVQKTSGGNNAFHNFHNDFTHITDLNERRRLALAEVDAAPFGWYHVRACVVAGVGFFTDSYDIFVVSMLTIMLGIVYYPGTGKMPTSSDNAIKLSTSAGTVVGQLGFGMLADIVGRKRMYGLELIVIIFATLAQALTSSSPSCSIIGLIIFWRVLMGVGIGGDYPLSSIITSEYVVSSERKAALETCLLTLSDLQVRDHQVAWCHDGCRLRHAGYWPARRCPHHAVHHSRLQEQAQACCFRRCLRWRVPHRC